MLGKKENHFFWEIMAWLLKSGRRKCLLSVVECQIPVFESFKIIDPPGKFSPKLLSAFGTAIKNCSYVCLLPGLIKLAFLPCLQIIKCSTHLSTEYSEIQYKPKPYLIVAVILVLTRQGCLGMPCHAWCCTWVQQVPSACSQRWAWIPPFPLPHSEWGLAIDSAGAEISALAVGWSESASGT